MPVLASCVLGGALLGLWLPVFPCASALACLPVGIGGLCLWFWRWPGLLFVVALAGASLDSREFLEQVLDPALTGQDILVQGYVRDFPRRIAADQGQSFDLSVTANDDSTLLPRFPRRIQLQWYRVAEPVVPGECWVLRVRLKPPHGFANRAGFDRLRGLFQRHTGAVGYVRDSILNHRCITSPWRSPGLKLRARFGARVQQSLPQESSVPLLLGISIGVRTEVTPAQWQLLRDTGTSHLMAISGLHIGMVAAGSWACLSWLGRVLARCGLRLPVHFVAAAGAASVAMLYASAAGFALPTVRALAMLLIALLLTQQQRYWRAGAVVSCALLGVVLFDARALLSAGFWLSFGAVVVLINCVRLRVFDSSDTLPSRLASIGQQTLLLLETQWVLGVGLAVPVLIFFDQLAVPALLANIIAIPLFTLLVMPLVFIGSALLVPLPALGTGLLRLSCRLLDMLLSYLEWLVAVLPVGWSPGPLATGTSVLLVLALIAVLLPRPFPRIRVGGVALVLAFGAQQLAQQLAGSAELRIHVLDVGQGLAVVIRQGERTLLYDAGPAWQASDAGERIVLPVLRKLGVTQLDQFIVSHGDSDHSGGMDAVLAVLPVRRLLTSAPLAHGVTKAQPCRAGETWHWGATQFEFLHPKNLHGWSDNNASCVLLIQRGAERILLPGDIELAAERVLTARYDLHDIDLVIAPHHGSRTSSGEGFVRVTQPRYVVFSTGFANRWGFPHADVATRWQRDGTCLLNTALSGTIEFAIDTEADSSQLVADRIWRSRWTQPWALRREDPCV
jgi:competence protein ComEC